MKILIILPRIPIPARDGGAIVMLETVRALHEAGHTVDVCAVNTAKHHASASAMQPYCSSIDAVDVDTSIRPLRLVREFVHSRFPAAFRIRQRASYWLTRFASDHVLERLESMIRERGPFDLVLCESLFTACYGEALRQRQSIASSVPIVLHAHNVEARIQGRLAEDTSRAGLERMYRRRLAQQTQAYERHVAQWCDAVISLSAIDGAIFAMSSPSTTVMTVSPGVQECVPSESPSPRTLWFLGSLDWTPNVDGLHWFMRQVWPMIRHRAPDVTLHIAGRSTPSDITQYHTGSDVIVHGEVDDPQAFRQRYAVGIVPLLSGSGVRIKILEALGGHAALVTTSVGCEGIPLVDGVHARIADDATAFAEACINLLHDASAQEALRRAGATLIHAEYSWRRSADNLQQALQTVIDRRQASLSA